MALSIEIRHGYVYLVEARTGKMSVGIQKTHYFEYPDDWVSESGIVNVEGFASLLMQHLKEQNMRDKKAYFCINNNAVIYRELNIPKVEEKKVHLLVKTEMMSALNLTPDYIMDYIYLNDVEIEGNVQSRVLGVAMQIKAIESLLEVAKLCKLDVQGIDSATNSIIKMMEENPLLENTNQLIVADIGNGHLRLYLFENGIYALSRNNKIISYKEVTPEEVTNS
ncbi:MAG: pilus assembly protein PilM, partial [Erysipelotrichaceae bacterium]